MKKVLAACAFLALSLPTIFAHPHVSLDARLQFEFDGKECRGFWVDWTFDAFFSATVINDFDANGNGRFEPAEIQKVYNGAFINLHKYGFFTLIRKGDKRTSPEAVENFSATVRDNRLVYRFFVPLDGKEYGRDFSVAIFDKTYYCAVRYPEDAVTITQSSEGASSPVWAREVNKTYPVYYNPAGATTDMTAYSKWKPGLLTAYPEEIHVQSASD